MTILRYTVEKSHTPYLRSWGVAYIFVGQLWLRPIGFEMKSNLISEPKPHHGKSPILVGPSVWQIPMEG